MFIRITVQLWGFIMEFDLLVLRFCYLFDLDFVHYRTGTDRFFFTFFPFFCGTFVYFLCYKNYFAVLYGCLFVDFGCFIA